jgi:hypothetical protein
MVSCLPHSTLDVTTSVPTTIMITFCRFALALLALTYSINAQYSRNITTSDCKCFPGDDCWPTVEEWSQFNATLNGRLIATVPLAAACHDDAWSSYNNATCAKLRSSWLDPETQWVDQPCPQQDQHIDQKQLPGLIISDGAVLCKP